jgi:hypothetical protein
MTITPVTTAHFVIDNNKKVWGRASATKRPACKDTVNSSGLFLTLPPEPKNMVLSHLSSKDITSLRRVSRAFK